MTETNALAGDVAPTPSEQASDAQPSPEKTLETQKEPETEAGEQPEPAEGEAAEAEKADAGDAEDSRKPGKKASEYIRELRTERNKLAAEKYALQQEVKKLRRPLSARDDMTDIQRAALEIRQADREEDLKTANERLTAVLESEHAARKAAFEANVGDSTLVGRFYGVKGITDAMADALVESDMAKELATYFVAKPEEAIRISRMEPHMQGLAIGRIEARLSKQPEVRKVSQAPEPSKVTLKGGANPRPADPNNMSVSEMQGFLRKAKVL